MRTSLIALSALSLGVLLMNEATEGSDLPGSAENATVDPGVNAEASAPEAEAEALKVKAPGVGDVAKDLIRNGKTNEEVLAAVKEQFPEAKTSMASINWYRNKLRSDGEEVPTARSLKAAASAEDKAAKAAEKQAEKDRIKAEKQAEKDRIKAEKQAEKDRIKAEKQAEKERKAAEAKAKAAPAAEQTEVTNLPAEGSEGESFLN